MLRLSDQLQSGNRFGRRSEVSDQGDVDDTKGLCEGTRGVEITEAAQTNALPLRPRFMSG